MAAAPMIAGLTMKIMRSRKQKKAEASAWSAGQHDVVVTETPVKV